MIVKKTISESAEDVDPSSKSWEDMSTGEETISSELELDVIQEQLDVGLLVPPQESKSKEIKSEENHGHINQVRADKVNWDNLKNISKLSISKVLEIHSPRPIKKELYGEKVSLGQCVNNCKHSCSYEQSAYLCQPEHLSAVSKGKCIKDGQVYKMPRTSSAGCPNTNRSKIPIPINSKLNKLTCVCHRCRCSPLICYPVLDPVKEHVINSSFDHLKAKIKSAGGFSPMSFGKMKETPKDEFQKLCDGNPGKTGTRTVKKRCLCTSTSPCDKCQIESMTAELQSLVSQVESLRRTIPGSFCQLYQAF